MKTKSDYLREISEIRDIMNRSSRFISLSGLSGVLAGIFALIGAGLAYPVLYKREFDRQWDLTEPDLRYLVLVAATVLLLSVAAAILLTTRKASARNLPVWDLQARRLVINLAIPLVTGGLLCLILLSRGNIGIMAPLTLIFYGLALVNASKYTLPEIRGLGFMEILLGLTASIFIGYGLFFWAAGFGLLHIVYGIFMYFKHER